MHVMGKLFYFWKVKVWLEVVDGSFLSFVMIIF